MPFLQKIIICNITGIYKLKFQLDFISMHLCTPELVHFLQLNYDPIFIIANESIGTSIAKTLLLIKDMSLK